MDIQLENIAGQFRQRLDELCPAGSREKSLALTNMEQALLWGEQARKVAGDDTLTLYLYKNPERVGWRGYVTGKGGVESWITLDGRVIQNTHAMDPATLPPLSAEVDKG